MFDEQEKHPSYGKIVVSRMQNNGTKLFGSEAKHNHLVGIRIYTAGLSRDLSRDWIFQDKEILELWMTEAQWANFVSSFGSGEGTPVTLRRYDGNHNVPFPPEKKPLIDNFKTEIKEKTKILFDTVRKAKKFIEEVRSRSVKKSDIDILSKMFDLVENQINNNMPFVERQFIEKLESLASDNQVNFEMYVQDRLNNLGKQTLATSNMKNLQLEKDEE